MSRSKTNRKPSYLNQIFLSTFFFRACKVELLTSRFAIFNHLSQGWKRKVSLVLITSTWCVTHRMSTQSDSNRQTMSQAYYNRKRQESCQLSESKRPAGQDKKTKPYQESGGVLLAPHTNTQHTHPPTQADTHITPFFLCNPPSPTHPLAHQEVGSWLLAKIWITMLFSTKHKKSKSNF